MYWGFSSDIMRRYMTATDIGELYRRMIFNILVCNTDDHPRNHGVVIDGEKMSLSPAYDNVPTPALSGVGTDFHLAMSVGEQGREATLENALSRSARFGLSKENAQAIISQLIKTTINWREHYEECGISGREVDILADSYIVQESISPKQI